MVPCKVKIKTESIDEFGEYQVKVWRRAFAIKPPTYYLSMILDILLMMRDIEMSHFRIYRVGESLKDTLDRVYPYWESEVKTSLFCLVRD